MPVARWFVCAVLLLSVLSLPAAEPVGPKPPAGVAPSVKLGTGTLVLYPVPEQQDVPTTFAGNEFPDPIPKARTTQAGYPITATFGPNPNVTAARGKLLDDQGQEVPAWFSSPQEPANDRYKGHQQHTLCLFPIQPLRPATTYTVRMEAAINGVRWQKTWKFTTAGETAPTDELTPVLARINEARALVGLEAIELDRDLCRGCQAHARYLARNLIDKPDLPLREEDPALPGATPEGRKVAARVVVQRGLVGVGMVEHMLGVYLNRVPLLYPGLKKIGLGVVADPAGGQLWVVEPFQFAEPIRPTPPTRWPAPDQKDVPVGYPGGSATHPVPDAALRDKAGYAVTAAVWARGEVENVEARLLKQTGGAVECWRSSPAEPAVAKVPQNTICLVPKATLEPATTYEVLMAATIDGKPWEAKWSFTTERADAGQAERARVEAKTVALLNAYRTTAGLPPVKLDPSLSGPCLKHAQYLKRNHGHPSTQGLGMHDEDPRLPGYSVEGQRAGKASVITVGPDPLAAVPAWIDTLYHRLPLLEPRLQRIGFASVPLGDGRWVSVLHSKP